MDGCFVSSPFAIVLEKKIDVLVQEIAEVRL